MRKVWTMVMAATVLTGCAASPSMPARLGPGGIGSTIGAQAAGSTYFKVFNGEAIGRNEVNEAAGEFVYEKAVALPLGPQGEKERVTQVMVNDLFGRTAAGGNREFVGVMTFYGKHVPNSFITHQKRLPFRLTLTAKKRVVRFEFDRVSLDGLKLKKPVFEAIDASERRRLEAEVLAFVEPRATPGDHVFAALFGRSERHTATIAEIKATAGAFGEFGRVLELKIPLRHKHGGLFHTYTFTALLDKRGRIVSVD